MSDETFYLLLGISSFTGALLLVGHLMQAGIVIRTLGQRLRYITLFLYSIGITFGSIELIHDSIPRDVRHNIYLLASVSLIVTMVFSIRETRKSQEDE